MAVHTREASIFERLNACMKEIGAVGKNSRNEQQKYMFRGIDALMDAAHPVFTENGVMVLPEVLSKEIEYRERVTDRGSAGVTTHVHLRVRFTFYGLAGDSIAAVTEGEASDTADKASNKAMSAAFKYALLQSLCIPLEDMADGDRETPDMGSLQRRASGGNRAGGGQQRQRAQRPAEPAPSAPPAPEWEETGEEHDLRQQLRAELGQVDDGVRARIVEFMRTNGIVLTRPCDPKLVAAVDKELTRLLEEAG